MNLTNLIEKTNILKQNLENGDSLLNTELITLFNDLNKFISPNKLKPTLSIMQDGTLLLKKKIQEFERLIQFLHSKEEYIFFIEKNQSNESLMALLMSTWHQPIVLPNFSLEFLIQSFTKLVENKPLRNLLGTNRLMPEETMEQEIQIMETEMEDFSEDLHSFLMENTNKFPGKLEDILEEINDIDDYYEKFTYVLHLLQKGDLIYDKESKTFAIRKN